MQIKTFTSRNYNCLKYHGHIYIIQYNIGQLFCDTTSIYKSPHSPRSLAASLAVSPADYESSQHRSSDQIHMHLRQPHTHTHTHTLAHPPTHTNSSTHTHTHMLTNTHTHTQCMTMSLMRQVALGCPWYNQLGLVRRRAHCVCKRVPRALLHVHCFTCTAPRSLVGTLCNVNIPETRVVLQSFFVRYKCGHGHKFHTGGPPKKPDIP